MADYPLPKFKFQVQMNAPAGPAFGFDFSEVSGLDFESEPIEYRHGASPKLTKIKMPGLQKHSNVTLKRGTYKGDNNAFEYWQKTQFFQEGGATGSMYRAAVTIQMLDETGQAIVTWKLENAWACKVQSTDLKADGNEVAIETMELCHEGLSVVHEG